MKKATLVLATAVAFLLSGPVFAARKVVDMPTTGTILSGSTSSIAENGVLKVSGQALTGEFIPGVKNPLAIVPETKIASSAISGLAKKVVKGGVAGLAIGAAFDAMIEGVGWIEGEGGQIQKPGASTDPVPTASGQYRWGNGDGVTYTASSALEGCQQSVARSFSSTRGVAVLLSVDQTGTATCSWTDPNNGNTFTVPSYRIGNGCPSGTVYDTVKGGCYGSALPVPLQDSDLGVLDGFVKEVSGLRPL